LAQASSAQAGAGQAPLSRDCAGAEAHPQGIGSPTPPVAWYDGMATKDDLVAQVKQLQRCDPDAGSEWYEYCDCALDGIYDPGSHRAEVLQRFLAAHEARSGQAAAEKNKLVAEVKRVQRSGEGNQAWSTFSDEHCRGTRDPNRVPAEMLRRFLDMSSDEWNFAAWPGVGPRSVTSPWGGDGAAKMWSSASMQPAGTVDGDICAADVVKAARRLSTHCKAAWKAYCALWGTAGAINPTKYDDEYLIGFIDYLGQLAVSDLAVVGAAAADGAAADAVTESGGGGDDGAGAADSAVPPKKRKRSPASAACSAPDSTAAEIEEGS